jgi:hypothetical protein
MSEKAETILKLLGGAQFVFMTGAKNFTMKKSSLSFDIHSARGGVNKIRITNFGEDCYSIETFNYNRRNNFLRPLTSLMGVSGHKLRDRFETLTGMHTRPSATDHVHTSAWGGQTTL